MDDDLESFFQFLGVFMLYFSLHANFRVWWVIIQQVAWACPRTYMIPFPNV